MVGQHPIRLDGNDPLRQEKKVGGRFHGGLHSHCLRKEWQSRARDWGQLLQAASGRAAICHSYKTG
jgi:hypothetical protein